MGCLLQERFEAGAAKTLRLLVAAAFANRGYRIKLQEDVFKAITLKPKVLVSHKIVLNLPCSARLTEPRYASLAPKVSLFLTQVYSYLKACSNSFKSKPSLLNSSIIFSYTLG